MRYVRFGLLLLGVTVFAFVVARSDPTAVRSSLSRLSWGLAIVLVLPHSMVTIFDTLGWRFAFLRDAVAFRALLPARLAGEAVNMATPTAALGGEAVKAWLLRGHVPLDESLPSVVISKTTITIAQGVFLLLGVALAGPTLPPDSPLLYGMQWLLALETVALAGFVIAQAQGLLGWSGRVLSRLGRLQAFVGHDVLLRVDGGLKQFYRDEPRRLLLSIVCHLIAWLLGAVETYWILRLLGVEVSLMTATVIEAFGAAVRVAAFPIPAGLGALEGGYVATFAALGLGSAAGLSFSLVRRLREALWVGIGLIAFAGMRAKASGRSSRDPWRRACP
jgi:putative membrane protein